MGKFRREALRTAAALASMTGCAALSTGRCISAFYAQTGGASWVGIGFSCALYGFFMGGIVRLKRKTGAESLPALYAGLFGSRAGAAFTALHAAFFALAAHVLVNAAADTAVLMLPLRNADAVGVFAILLTSLWLSRSGYDFIKGCGCMCFAALAVMMLALLLCGEMPGREALHFYVRLKLEGNISAALFLAAVHASLAGGMCAAAAVRLYPMHMPPAAAGLASAAAYGALLLAGNTVFCAFPPEINALRHPFVALSGRWGKAGYYLFALMRYWEAVISMCGIFCILPKNGMRKKAEIRC